MSYGKSGMGVRSGGWVLLLASLGLAASAQADTFGISEPVYGGNGCPQGSARLAAQQATDSVTLEFDQYNAKVGSGSTLNRVNCSIALPVIAPAGMKVVLGDVSPEGWIEVPKGTSAKFTFEAFIGGSQGPVFSKGFNGSAANTGKPLKADVAGDLITTGCGGSFNLRLNTSVLLRARAAQATGSFNVSRLKFGVRLEPCAP